MDAFRRNFIKLSVITAVSLAISGCKKNFEKKPVLSDSLDVLPTASSDDVVTEDYSEKAYEENTAMSDFLSVSRYPDDSIIDWDARELYLKFNKPIDANTLNGDIYLSDKTGNLMDVHTVIVDPKDSSYQRVLLKLNSDFYLKESWKYMIVVTSQVKSTSGDTLQDTNSLVLHTTSKNPFEALRPEELQRTKIAVISDLHMNEQRGFDKGYSLFTQNAKLLVDFLEYVRTSDQIKELIILGDLMDMWVVPMAYDTYSDPITNTEEFFLGVSEASVNREVVAKLNLIANENKIRFSYVPGNHDMLLTEDIFHMIFPQGHWHGSKPGTGVYSPESSVILEHGHNYDLYNAPDSVTTAGSLLPPGYFITRIFATGNLLSTEKLPMEMQLAEDMSSEFIYTTSWDMAVVSISIPNFDPTTPQIHTDIDGYTQIYSSNEARDIYTQNIEANWKERQIENGVRVPNSVSVGIMNGSGMFLWFGTLEYSAIAQYFTQDPKINIVVFGHTHNALLKQDWETLDNIYANTGTWVDSQYLKDDELTGTCVIINTSASSGSDLENVTLYQAVSDDDGKMHLEKINEKNLDTTQKS